ncbi:MAG TPA: AAA family ATPase, partial [Anaerolineales bacterium]|nr:AAA family ATPase [Anaerolineales bacterium]
MDKNPPFWALYLLGAPRLENAGQIVEMDTRKALALLAYLALAGGQTRESLATLFWPEYDQASARGALRRTLSTLQKATLGDLLDISRERVQIRSSAPLRVDVQVFHQLLLDANNPATAGSPGQSQQILQQAVDLVHGDFLQGFTLRDSPTFDDWQYFQTDSLRRELGSALEKLALGYSQRTDDNEAIQAVRRWLALDELQEDAHRLLMKLYAWTGQRGAALRQYRECVRILEQELGVPPLPETTQLYEAILENQLPARPAAETPAIPEYPANPTPGEGYSLTGREAELGQLLNIYWTGAGNGAFVVVEGEAGIGKTRLAEEILGIAQRAGAATLTARCYEGETQLAYGPFLEGIPNLLNQPGSQSALVKIPVHWLREAVRLVPALNELRPDLPSPLPAEGPGAQSRFFEGIRQFLVGLLAGGQTGKLPGILLLDDLHWADPATLDLLIYLVRRLRGHSLMVLVTLRDRAGAEAARISSLLAETIRSGYGYVIPLARLSPEAVALLSEHSMQPLSEELRLRLYQETEGLPLLVLAYLDSMQPLDGTNWEMPASVRNIFHSRMPTPDSPGWQLLTTAAVIGRAFDFDTLRQASGRSEVET